MVGNFEIEEVYKINEFCIALKEVTEAQVASLKGKKILVVGTCKTIEGKLLPVKTNTDGRMYEPYKEPDKKFIASPTFKIISDNPGPVKKRE